MNIGILWYWFWNWAVAKRSCLSGGAKGMLTRQLTLCLRTHGFSLRAGIVYACLRWCLHRLAYNRILLTRGPYCRFLTKHISKNAGPIVTIVQAHVNHEGFQGHQGLLPFLCWVVGNCKKSRATHLALLGNLGHRLFHLEILTPSVTISLPRGTVATFTKHLDLHQRAWRCHRTHLHWTWTWTWHCHRRKKTNLTTQHSLPLCFSQEHSLLFFSGPPVHDNSRVRMEMKPQKYRAMNTSSVCGARAHHL